MMRSSNRLYKKITFLHELYLFSKKVTLKIKFQSQVLTGRHRLVHWVRFGMLPSYMAWKLGNLVAKSTTTPGSPLPLEFDGPWLLSISISAGNFFSTFEPSPVEVELKPCFPRGNRETDSRLVHVRIWPSLYFTQESKRSWLFDVPWVRENSACSR